MEIEQIQTPDLNEAEEKTAAELASEFQEVAHALAEKNAAIVKPKLSPGELATKYAPSSMPQGCLMHGISLPNKVLAPLEGTYKCLRKGRELAALSVGERVERGQTLGFIEVMTMQCMIQAPCKGTIESLYVQHGKRVMLDQCLMIIRPQV